MRELFWIGPPEHGRSEDRVRLWLEPDDLLTQRVGGKKVKRSAGTNEPYLIVGFDTEFKTPNQAFTSEEIHAGFATSLILSYQFYAHSSDGRVWKGICCPDKDERMSLDEFLMFVIGSGARLEGFKGIPSKIYLVGHFTRADIPAFANFQELSWLVSAVRNTFVSINKGIETSLPVGDHEVNLTILLRDTMLLTPQSSRSLKKIGEMVGIDKVELSSDRKIYKQMIRNMDVVRRDQWELFKRYAITDAEICVQYIQKVMAEYKAVTGDEQVPLTLTGIGIDLLEKHWKDVGYNSLSVLGQEMSIVKTFNTTLGYYKKTRKPIDLKLVHYNKALAIECYHGGRNEQYWFGPCFEDDWSDFDLSSAYPTAMALIGMPDWLKMFESQKLSDFQPTVLGYALIEFEFPSETRYPTLPVRVDGSLVFPLKGETECSAPEIYLAHKLGAKIKIIRGLIVPSDSSKPVFTGFISQCIQRRTQAGKNSLQGLFWKEISNSTYGKTAQGLRNRRVFDLSKREMGDLPASRITNPFFAAFITSYVRAVLGEIMNSIPSDKMIFSCTTDGFLTNISDDEAYECTKGELCRLFSEQRLVLTGDSSVLEKKHYVRNPLGWRTRGQATLSTGVPEDKDGKHLILAKGGLWIKPEFEEAEEQNEEILNYFFQRTPETVIEIEGKTGLRDMVLSGADFVDKLVVKRLSMEYDWKRRPHGYKFSEKFGHIAFSTDPWSTVDQYTLMRETFELVRKDNPICIKTVNDFLNLSSFVETKTVTGLKSLPYISKKSGGDIQKLRQYLCYAFKNRKAGFNNNRLSNEEFANLLSENGIKCTKANVENGLKRDFLENKVPPTEMVLSTLNYLKANVFKLLDVGAFPAPVDKNGLMIKLAFDSHCPFIEKLQ